VTVLLDEHVTKYSRAVGTQHACAIFGVKQRSHRHRQQRNEGRLAKQQRPECERKPHPATMTQAEKDVVVELLCSERWCDISPTQVFWALLDEGKYFCSERQMYRILLERNLTGDRRGRHGRKRTHRKPRLKATKPNVVWCWDITALRGPAKGIKYYLYSFIDLFSRKIVAWSVHTTESEALARRMMKKACKDNGIEPKQLTIHADRGSPMIAGSVEELLGDLGVVKSHSRPRVSNDNAFIEASFKTVKYRPDYPERFESINQARAWCRKFFTWYNEEHYHSGISYQHPADVHDGTHKTVTKKRQETLDAAHRAHPHRFSKRPAPKPIPKAVYINRPTIEIATN
jgi:putative transposase